MSAILPLVHFFVALLLAAGLNWVGLIPWRRSNGLHWTERARILYPARRAAAVGVFLIAVICGSAQAALLPDVSHPVFRAGIPALLGAILGSYPFEHELFPTFSFRTWLHAVSATWILQLIRIFIFVGAMFAMPLEWDWRAPAIVLGVIALQSWLVWGGILRIARWTGLIVPAPERLLTIVNAVAGRIGVPPPKTWVMRGMICNAFAMPHTRMLVVTEQLLTLTPDDEVAAICAHEFGHLMETRRVLFIRFLSSVGFIPTLFIRPVGETFGPAGILVLCLSGLAVSRFVSSFGRKMENAADSVALAHEGEAPGTYARTLARLYEANQIPAVMPGKRQIHPHLYDRLLTAGVTPDFARPAPAKSLSWLGYLTLAAAAVMYFYAAMLHTASSDL